MSNCTFEIANFEYRSSRLRSCTLQLRAVYLNKAMAAEIFTEEMPDGGLHPEYSLICGCLEVSRSDVRSR